MQTREQVLAKVEEMLDHAKAGMLKEANFLCQSGALDFESAADDYMIPKLIVSVVFTRTAAEYRPFSRDGRNMLNNLSSF